MGDRRVWRGVAALVAGVALALTVLAGCSSTPVDPTGATILDVRTASEYAAGHLKGAVNIDVQGADFGTKIGALDKGAHYIVYCRSGNRSATAAKLMKTAGFTNVTDAGGIDAASKSTGLPIVT